MKDKFTKETVKKTKKVMKKFKKERDLIIHNMPPEKCNIGAFRIYHYPKESK